MPTSSENDITGCEQSSVAPEQPAADSQSSLPQGAQRHTGKLVSRGSPCAPLCPLWEGFLPAPRSRHSRVLRLRRTAAELNLSLGTALAHQQQANAFQQIHGLVHSLGQENIGKRFALVDFGSARD